MKGAFNMKKIIIFILKLTFIIFLITVIINIIVIATTKKQIINIKNIKEETTNFDCIIILGAGIRNNRPSPMLEDRLITGKELYNMGISKKILVSGDHSKIDYDEVKVMKNYLIENGIPSDKIFMDHAGFSTYDSIYRAKKIFNAKKIVIVTQDYHLYRALYIANKLNIEALGIPANKRTYQNQAKRDIREYVARIKDAIKCITKPQSTYLGEIHPIEGNGDTTNDNKVVY